MAGIQDFWVFEDDFIGAGTFVATPGLDVWDIADTSAAGTPTYTRLDHGTTGGAAGVAELAFDVEAEAQNVCLSFADKLCMDINDRLFYETRLKQGQATVDATTSMAFGLIGDRNDAIDSIAQAMIFRIIGTNVLVVESDDGTTDKDDQVTGESLTNAYRVFKIDASDLTSVKFFVGGKRVAPTVTFDVSAYAGALQPFFQIQKTANANANSLHIDYVKVTGRRIT